MTRSVPVIAGALLLLAACAASGTAQVVGDASDGIRNRIEAGRAVGRITAAEHGIRARNALPEFYLRRFYAPAWTTDAGPTPDAMELVRAVRAGSAEGLDPEDYRVETIEALLARGSLSGADRVDVELLLTDAFLVYGSHLLHGRVNPETIDPEWIANRRSTDMATVLEEAIVGRRIGASLEALRPGQTRYARLVRALEELEEVQARGGWGSVPAGEKLERGSDGPRVAALRARLIASGDLTQDDGSTGGSLFDGQLEAAVRDFQRRHGLEADGVVGKGTIEALNVPVSERIRQVEVNLERWRWLPADLGARHIEVNIASFETKVVENGAPVLVMRSIVGRPYRETPSFSARMTYLVLAPYWNVPPTIAAEDKLPLIKKDSGYLSKEKMVLFEQATNSRVDPSTVDWSSLTGRQFNARYRIRQDPGPRNALGSVKFMFPNRHHVYLHDTPSRELFARAARDFSSGCIRLQRPLDLAEYLLRDDPRWSRPAIDAAVASGAERTVQLASPVPVHLLYFTAWVEEDGTLAFRSDIYGRDRAVALGLAADSPGA